MNILTSSGLCGRYITDWTGPEALLQSQSIRLGAPNYPGDTMTLSGSVLSKEAQNGAGLVEVGLRGANRLGDHVTGKVKLTLPGSIAV
jgi:acyl dehydratase